MNNIPNKASIGVFFENPPLIEVAFSIQYDTIFNFSSLHAGIFWKEIREIFPNFEQHPPLESVQEKEKVELIVNPLFKLEYGAPDIRFWLLSNEKNELIQIQKDRFAYNWKKKNNNHYPRYKELFKKFTDFFKQFNEFIINEKLDNIKPNQCELSYVNHIEPNSVWKEHSDIAKIFTVFNPSYPLIKKQHLENISFNAKHSLHDIKDNFAGRLHIDIKPIWKPPLLEPAFRMTLTARGKPFEENIESSLQFYPDASTSIVEAFVALTSSQMHTEWRRKNDPLLTQ
jgi:uncharacterized protein (TIGR04255 family)